MKAKEIFMLLKSKGIRTFGIRKALHKMLIGTKITWHKYKIVRTSAFKYEVDSL